MKMVRANDDTHELLQKLAEAEDRPMARIVAQAVEEYAARRVADPRWVHR